MNYVFPPAPQAALPVAGDDAVFPVRRVYCVGRNYADHAAEMGADTREPPFFFSKPADALVPGGVATVDVLYPPQTAKLQHEVELVVAIGRGGANIPVAEALDCVFGYTVGFDLTRRDLQGAAKDKGHPWDMGKGFDQGGPVGALRPAAEIGHPEKGAIWLKVNGEFRQQGDLAQMTWKVAEVIANPTTRVADITELAGIAHNAGAVLSVDSTFSPPPLYRPLADGADLVVHSLTKYINGHGDAMGGAVIGSAADIATLRHDALTDVGGVISPFNAWLIMRGSVTLPLRLAQHQANAQRIAEFLAGAGVLAKDETHDGLTSVVTEPGLWKRSRPWCVLSGA